MRIATPAKNLKRNTDPLSSYRIVPDSGKDWPSSMRKLNSCVICKHAVLAESAAYWVVTDERDTSGMMRLTCSEECANMFILQNMNEVEEVIFRDINGKVV